MAQGRRAALLRHRPHALVAERPIAIASAVSAVTWSASRLSAVWRARATSRAACFSASAGAAFPHQRADGVEDLVRLSASLRARAPMRAARSASRYSTRCRYATSSLAHDAQAARALLFRLATAKLCGRLNRSWMARPCTMLGAEPSMLMGKAVAVRQAAAHGEAGREGILGHPDGLPGALFFEAAQSDVGILLERSLDGRRSVMGALRRAAGSSIPGRRLLFYAYLIVEKPGTSFAVSFSLVGRMVSCARPRGYPG